MALPTTLYVSLSSPREVLVLSGVVAWAYRYERKPEVYRDLFDVSQGTIANAGGSGALNSVAAVPVLAVEGTSYVAGGAASTMTVKPAAPDDMTHTPPREAWTASPRDLIVSLDAAYPIPAVDTPLYKAKTFTATAATDLCTSTAHTFENGDLVTVHSSANDLPLNLVSTAIYTLLKVDADTFRLALNGAVVDIGDAGTGTHTVVLVTPAKLPANLDNLLVYPAHREPAISITDPRGLL